MALYDEKKLNNACDLAEKLREHSSEVLLGDPLVEDAAEMIDDLVSIIQDMEMSKSQAIYALKHHVMEWIRDQGADPELW